MYIGRRDIALFMLQKKKVLVSCVITEQLICAFVFAYAKGGFSHDTAQIRACLRIKAIPYDT